MTFDISLTRQAERDLDHILEWLAQRSAQGAMAWAHRWDEVLGNLERSADRCGLAPESGDHDETIHQIIFKTRRGLPYRARVSTPLISR